MPSLYSLQCLAYNFMCERFHADKNVQDVGVYFNFNSSERTQVSLVRTQEYEFKMRGKKNCLH